MGNIHFTEILDFFLGWFGFDTGNDDWATRLTEEEKALQAPPGEPSKDPEKEPSKELSKEPPKEPPKAPPKKPPDEPPPKKPEKTPPPSGKKFKLEDLVP